MKFAGGRADQPIPITPSGGNLYRPAIAVDGAGQPWVFWSQNDKGNFDVWGRVVENGKPGTSVRISAAAGSDIDVVAATDSRGRVCGSHGRAGGMKKPGFSAKGRANR
jgi:hypothetical protein